MKNLLNDFSNYIEDQNIFHQHMKNHCSDELLKKYKNNEVPLSMFLSLFESASYDDSLRKLQTFFDFTTLTVKFLNKKLFDETEINEIFNICQTNNWLIQLLDNQSLVKMLIENDLLSLNNWKHLFSILQSSKDFTKLYSNNLLRSQFKSLELFDEQFIIRYADQLHSQQLLSTLFQSDFLIVLHNDNILTQKDLKYIFKIINSAQDWYELFENLDVLKLFLNSKCCSFQEFFEHLSAVGKKDVARESLYEDVLSLVFESYSIQKSDLQWLFDHIDQFFGTTTFYIAAVQSPTLLNALFDFNVLNATNFDKFFNKLKNTNVIQNYLQSTEHFKHLKEHQFIDASFIQSLLKVVDNHFTLNSLSQNLIILQECFDNQYFDERLLSRFQAILSDRLQFVKDFFDYSYDILNESQQIASESEKEQIQNVQRLNRAYKFVHQIDQSTQCLQNAQMKKELYELLKKSDQAYERFSIIAENGLQSSFESYEQLIVHLTKQEKRNLMNI